MGQRAGAREQADRRVDRVADDAVGAARHEPALGRVRSRVEAADAERGPRPHHERSGGNLSGDHERRNREQIPGRQQTQDGDDHREETDE